MPRQSANGDTPIEPDEAGEVHVPGVPADEPHEPSGPARPMEPAAPDPQVAVWLKACKAVLLAEGFTRDPKQARKPGMVWGVVRQEPDDLQIHVRAFRDGRLESEVELSNKYVQHLWSKRRNAAPEVKEILGRHGMPTSWVSETFLPITGAKEDKKMPTGRTKSTHLTLTVAIGLALILGRQWLQATLLRKPRIVRQVLIPVQK